MQTEAEYSHPGYSLSGPEGSHTASNEPDVPVSDVVKVSIAVAAVPGRKDKVALLAAFLGGVPPSRVGRAVGILSGALPTPPLGIGPARLRAAWRQAAAQTSLLGPESPLTLGDLERGLRDVASQEGKGSVARKVARLRALLEHATPEESAFVLRLCLGELRQGALDGVMIEAIARAFNVLGENVRRAHMLSGDLPHTARVAATEGEDGLSKIGLRVLRPLEPMLASTVETPHEAIARHGTTILEWKLDGARIQVHKAGSDVRVFTRTLRDVSATLPDIVAPVSRLAADEIVLDGEAIALRPDGTPHPFQTTMGRFGASRKDAAREAEVPLTPFFFDVLHLDGATLIDRPLRERSAILRSLVATQNLLPALETDSPEEADAFLRGARERGHEGVMAKDPDSPYEAGRRGKGWLKIKPAKTLDLVVLAVERGSGRREGWWSNLHLGARDEEGGFVMLGKTFKGLTDEILRWQTEAFPALATRVEGHVMYLRPEVVAEIAFNEIQVSPRYPGGLALRFARLKRYRPDRTPSQADTISTVRALFTAQTGGDPP
jgi:DNA ligase-1